MMKVEDMLTTDQLSKAIGVSRQTIGIWRLKGLPCFQLASRTFLYDLNVVKEWRKENVNTKSQYIKEV